MSADGKIEDLEKFVLHNPDLDKLEGLLGQFNVFETLNAVKVEVRHSYVLAWLLNPTGNHGLGDIFIKQFLKYVVSTNRESIGSRMSVFDFEFLDYGDVEVRREWNNIDIIVVVTDPKRHLLLAIENKITSAEHDDQLRRYRTTVEREFPEATRLYVYLTPENLIPSDEEWIPFDYGTVSELLRHLLDERKDSINPNVANFISQYDTVLRRYIVGKSEIEQICRQIYRNHQAALDLIFQYRPDIESEVSEYVTEELKMRPDVIVDSAAKTLTRFTVEALDILVDKVGEGWTASKRILMFEFNNYNQRLVLRLYIGPGQQECRTKLRDVFLKDTKLFNKVDRKPGTKWHAVYQREFLKTDDYEDATFDELKAKIAAKLKEFFGGDLRKIVGHVVEHWRK